MLGSFITAVIGGLVVLLAERVRWQREDRLRWLPERRSLYLGFLAAVDRWDELDHEAAVRGELEEWFDAPPEDRLEPLLGVQTSTRLRPRANAARIEAHYRLTELALVGSAHVHRRAESVVARLLLLSDVRLTSPPRECGACSDELNIAQAAFQERRVEFIDAVRHELGT